MTEKEKGALFLELFEKHRRLVTRIVTKTLSGSGRMEDVLDVMQETFIKCRRNFDPEKNFKFERWAAECGKRNAFDFLRKRTFRRQFCVDHVVRNDEGTVSLLEQYPDERGTPESLLSEAQERDAARRFISEGMGLLHPAIAAALRLRYMEERPFREIARLTRTNENTAKTRVRCGLKHLRRLKAT